MTASVTDISPGVGGLAGGYAPLAGIYDEMFDAGAPRPHCRGLLAGLEKIGPGELARRWEQAQRLIRDNGMTYSPLGDPDRATRPWDLDGLPLVIAAEEWRTVTAGLAQRARLLNAVLDDLYSSQRLLQRGLLPAEFLFAHPGFLRPIHGQRISGGCHLQLYAADLARSADGRWWVVADRSESPLGAGYALENRIVIARMLPGVIRECHVQRLAGFFIALRETLQNLAPQHRENPRIVILSKGPRSPSYFEDAYLARYLGYTLVETGDLAVRNDRVLLKTLGGLLQVDVIVRRLGSGQCDPLELRGDPALGVPGLLQAARSGNVVVANALGSGLVESAALMAFLPGLCRELLGEELLLPSVATWWCGQEEGRRWVVEHLDGLAVRAAYRRDRQPQISSEVLESMSRDELAAAIQARPWEYVGQERVDRSTAPIRAQGTWQAARIALRAFAVASGASYKVLPGGLVRVANESAPLDVSILAGQGSKDAWVLADGPVEQVSLLKPGGQAVELRRSGAELPSRVADNLLWLGRYVERAEAAARILRTVLVRLSGESHSDVLDDPAGLLRAMAAQGLIEPGFVVEGIRQQMPAVDQVLPAAVLDERQASSLRATLAALYRAASVVRDRISIDSWRIIVRIDRDVEWPEGRTADPADLLALINPLVIDLAAFSGLVAESTTRTQGWRFLEIGRRLERAMNTISLVRHALLSEAAPSAAVLDAVLETADSQMTYRSRYLATLELAPVLDLLLTDETNPRSLAYQLVALCDHVEHLPRDRTQALRGAEQRLAMRALNSIRMVDEAMLGGRPGGEDHVQLDRLLQRLAEQLPKLSELIAHKYLVHAGVPRQLAEYRAEGDG